MKIIHTIKALRETLNGLSGTIGFVPTMGNLHQGHTSLIQRAANENDTVIISIFVNPTQFNNSTDYQKYPRTLEQDIVIAKQAGSNIIFAPDEQEMYPDHYQMRINCLDDMMTIMEGKFRPGHFEGMLTIVLKLLSLMQADRAYFSEKDFQQLYLVKKIATAFLSKTEIIACPIIRLSSGLPLSSRNNNLSEQGLAKAEKMAKIVRSNLDTQTVLKAINNEKLKVDYIEDHQKRRFIAIFVENIRLIDNFSLQDIQ